MTVSDSQRDFMLRAGSHRLLTHAEEIELARKIQARGPDWKEARNELVMHNVRLALTVGREFQNRGLEFEDLVQAILFGSASSADSNISGGIARAAEKYDGRGRFSTYAMIWAKQAAQKACEPADTIRLPNVVKKIRLTALNNPEMTDAEVAAKHDAPVSHVRRARTAATVAASLDAPKRMPDGDGGNDYDKIQDLDADDPAEVADESGWIRQLVDTLPAQEHRVVEMLYGLNGYGGREHTTAEIADVLGLTLLATRKLQTNALKLLRAAVRPDETPVPA
jgi:RNA polymerase sigma factor (sigma-70 family)